MLSFRELAGAAKMERIELERIIAKLAQSDLILFSDPSAKQELLSEVYDSGRSEDFPGAHEVAAVAGEPLEVPEEKEPLAAVSVSATAETGEWTHATLFNILVNIHGKKRTGVLRLHAGEKRYKALFFNHGELVNISTVPFNAAECLGRIVQRAGLLEQDQVVESLHRARQSGRKQGEELLAMGVLRNDRLQELLRVHIEVKMSELFTWGEGTYHFQPMNDLPAKVTEIPVDFPRLMFNLIWKRYPFEDIDERFQPLMDKFLGKSEHSFFEPEDFGFGESLAKFYKIVTERDAPLKRMLIVSNLKPEQTSRMIWAMYLLGVVDFFEESREDRVMLRIQELNEQLKTIEKGTLFDVLGVHWTANDEQVRSVYERRVSEIEAAIGNSHGLEQQLTRSLQGHIEKAFEVLREQAGRRAYRSEIFDPDFIEFGADILRQKGESYLFTKEELEQAIIELESALEVYEKSGEYWSELGLAYYYRDYPRDMRGAERARQLIKRGLAMSPKSTVTNLCLGLMFRHERKNKQAIEALQRVLEIEEGHRFAKVLLREIRTGEKQGERDRAVKEFIERPRAADKEFDEMLATKRVGKVNPEPNEKATPAG